MLINPALRMSRPRPIREIWKRNVESAGRTKALDPVARGSHWMTKSEVARALGAGHAEETPLGPVYETTTMTPGTLAALNVLRAADAEVAARALLAGAKAHGSVDLARLKLILTRLDEIGATPADHAYVLAHLADASDIQELVDAVRDRTTAQETYHLAVSMMDPAIPRDRAWLDELQLRLRERTARFV